MFCIVDIYPEADSSKIGGFFSFLFRRAESRHPVELSRVKLDGYPPFHIFRVSRRELCSKEAMQVYRVYKGKVIFPACDISEELREYEFIQHRYGYEKMRLLTAKTLSYLPKNAKLDSVLIRDKTLRCCAAVYPFIPKIGRITVITDDDEKFDELSDKVMENYGAVVLRGKDFLSQNLFDLIIDADNGILYYTPDRGKVGACSSVKPDATQIPEELKNALPSSCDRESVAAAMFEICGFLLDNI